MPIGVETSRRLTICALKAQQALARAGAFAPLLGPSTAVLTAMNGIPWWYFYKERGPLDGHHLEGVDPGAAQWNAIGPERAIGCVVDPACEVVAPGVIQHRLFKRFTIGEPDGSNSERIVALRDALVSAGFDAPIRNTIPPAPLAVLQRRSAGAQGAEIFFSPRSPSSTMRIFSSAE